MHIQILLAGVVWAIIGILGFILVYSAALIAFFASIDKAFIPACFLVLGIVLICYGIVKD